MLVDSFGSKLGRWGSRLSFLCILISWRGCRDGHEGLARLPYSRSLAGKLIAGRRGLSVQFRNIVEKAGVTEPVVTREGKGRTINSKTFHALRHFSFPPWQMRTFRPKSARSWPATATQRCTPTTLTTSCRRCRVRLRSFQASRRHEKRGASAKHSPSKPGDAAAEAGLSLDEKLRRC